MKNAILITAAVMGIFVVGMLFRFGTLSPCGALKQEMKAQTMRFALKKSLTDKRELLGNTLGATLAGTMIDTMVDSLTPMECTSDLFRMVKGDRLFAESDVDQYTCEVCMTFKGRTKCRTASESTRQTALRMAQDNVCAFLVRAGMTDSFECSQTRPTQMTCQKR